MASILSSLRNTVFVSFVLALLVVLWLGVSVHSDADGFGMDLFFGTPFIAWLLRWFHVVSGIMWIGLLYYFNFVQIPNMPKIPDEHKPAISKVIAPKTLFWFRWAALSTIVSGLLLGHVNGWLVEALTMQSGHQPIGLGMWLGAIMAYNVWFVIWPNQKRALGLVEADAETKAKSARMAMLFSRTNTLLSLPMLVCMTVAQNPF